MRVLILHDCNGWAQHRHATGLQKHAGYGYTVAVRQLGTADPAVIRAAQVIYTIYFAAAKKFPGKLSSTCVASHGWLYPKYDPNDWRTRGVSELRNSKNGEKNLLKANYVVCRNRELEQWAEAHGSNARYIPAGVDTDLFNTQGRVPNNGKLRIGWCGQARADFKGYTDIFLPLRERLSSKYEFVSYTHTAKEALSPEHMAGWYKSLDVFLTTASAEGTPNPPFEAAACGCVVLATDVGQLTDWEILRKSELLVPTFKNQTEAESVIDRMTHRLETLEDSLERKTLSELLAFSIERDYSYRVIAPQTLKFISGGVA